MDPQRAAALAAHLLDDRRVNDDPWHQLSTGALTREKVVALRSRFEPPEEIARKLELFGPTSKERSDEVLKILLQRYFPGAEPGSGGPDTGEAGAATEGTESGDSTDGSEASSARVVDLPRAKSQRWWIAAASGGVALAAAVLLAWVMRPPELLPSFDLELEEVSMGDMRGSSSVSNDPAAGCDERYRREQTVVALLVPNSSPGEGELKVAVRAQRLASDATGTEEIWPKAASSERNERDELRLELPLADEGLTPGTWVLTFYVVPEEQRYHREALRELEPGAHPGVSVARTTICIEE